MFHYQCRRCHSLVISNNGFAPLSKTCACGTRLSICRPFLSNGYSASEGDCFVIPVPKTTVAFLFDKIVDRLFSYYVVLQPTTLKLSYKVHEGISRSFNCKLPWIVMGFEQSIDGGEPETYIYRISDKARDLSAKIKTGTIGILPFHFGNVYLDGRICWGSNYRPLNPLEAISTFFGAPFNGDLSAYYITHAWMPLALPTPPNGKSVIEMVEEIQGINTCMLCGLCRCHSCYCLGGSREVQTLAALEALRKYQFPDRGDSLHLTDRLNFSMTVRGDGIFLSKEARLLKAIARFGAPLGLGDNRTNGIVGVGSKQLDSSWLVRFPVVRGNGDTVSYHASYKDNRLHLLGISRLRKRLKNLPKIKYPVDTIFR